MLTYAKVIEDSISPAGKRLTTLELMYPRYILAELNTHRAFSRNSSSSRAIPVKKLIRDVEDHCVVPEYWGRNQPGMQASEELTGAARFLAIDEWCKAATHAMDHARELDRIGAHKQVVNRLLEPFQYIRTLVTATEWENFFALRCHPDAQPEMQELAEKMREAINESDSIKCKWHLPYISNNEKFFAALNRDFLGVAKISAARCARVSYLKHNGDKPSIEDDLALFDRLAGSKPMHCSPLEHQAIAFDDSTTRSRNFVGWKQFREIWEDEHS